MIWDRILYFPLYQGGTERQMNFPRPDKLIRERPWDMSAILIGLVFSSFTINPGHPGFMELVSEID